MKNILILSTFDNPAAGHGHSLYLSLKENGENAFFLSFIRQYTDDAPCFINARTGYPTRRKILAAMLRFQKKLMVKAREYDFFNMLIRGVSAKDILKRTPFKPEIIIVNFYDYYLSPRTIHDLYAQTQAKIVIVMVDSHILGGGCHYPCGCTQYINGCMRCPALRLGFFAREEYKRKKKYLSDIPITLVGTRYDIERAERICYLKNTEKINSIGTPDIPFSLTRKEAREKLGIPEDNFVLMFGAVNISLKRKGFTVLKDALTLFSEKIGKKNVTLLVAGNNDNIIDIPNINIYSPGYMNLDKLFTAFYASNLFVSPSLDDSGPYMVNYSVACGTPVLSFPIGIAIDLVRHKETGYLASYGSSEGLSDGMEYFYNVAKDDEDWVKENCLGLMDRLKKNNTPWYLKMLEK